MPTNPEIEARSVAAAWEIMTLVERCQLPGALTVSQADAVNKPALPSTQRSRKVDRIVEIIREAWGQRP